MAFVDVCKSWNIPYSIERSRSGNGAHVWIFFDSPVLAVKARQLGNAILTEAMNRDGKIGFKSYDRFFPNQDTLPEGGLGNLVEKSVAFRFDDETNHGRSISVHFNGELRNEQKVAVDALTSNNTGVLSATTAFGKTVAAIGLIAKHGVNTLILVHTRALLDQWVQRLEQFLVIDDIPVVEESKRRKKVLSPIGILSSIGNKLHGIIDIALMQSCISDNEVKPFVKDYGMVIADECHHVSAVNFEQILFNT